jgi:hypothetical protein
VLALWRHRLHPLAYTCCLLIAPCCPLLPPPPAGRATFKDLLATGLLLQQPLVYKRKNGSIVNTGKLGGAGILCACPRWAALLRVVMMLGVHAWRSADCLHVVNQHAAAPVLSCWQQLPLPPAQKRR